MADKIDKTKKRKRHTDGSSKPSKKVAIEADKTVNFSFHDAEKWAPVIASTPGLTIPNKINLEPYTKARQNAPQRPGRSGPIATTELLLQSSSHPKLDYLAREEDVGGADALLKHYLGVYDPKTGKLEVVEARKMVVRGSVRNHQARAEDTMPMGIRDQRNNLGQAFGTKKSKKAIASVTENAIGPARTDRSSGPPKLDAVAAAIVDSMAEAAEGMSTQSQLQEAADAAKPRPKANLNAKDIKDVYTTDILIGSDMFKHVPTLEWAQAVKAEKEIRVTSSYVANRIQAVSISNEKLKVLRYLCVLLDFFRISKPARGGRVLPRREEIKAAMPGIPEVLVESIRRKFSDGGNISKFQQDLLITHCCALAMLVDNYEVEYFDLRMDLSLEPREMAQYFMEIGAKIFPMPEATRKTLGLEKAMAAQRKVAKLRIPLDFPKVTYGRKR